MKPFPVKDFGRLRYRPMSAEPRDHFLHHPRDFNARYQQHSDVANGT